MKNGFTISPVKTLYGHKWAVLNETKNIVELPSRLAIYDYDKKGLNQARETLDLLRSGKKAQ